MEMNQLLDLAKTASLQAGEKIIKVYESEDFGVQQKDDNSPLTLADQASHQTICDHLVKTDIPILSEEGKDVSFEERRNWKTYWLIDPLDGTKEFIKRNGEFTVNIALMQENHPILGVVYAPVLDWLYWGVEGQGAYKSIGGEFAKITTEKPDLTASQLKIVASRSHLNQETKDFLATLKEPEIVSMGSSLKFMLVAEGKAHLYPRYAPTMEWDTAAAHAVVEAAGGYIYKEPGRQQFEYNKENLLNPHFLVSG